MTLVFALGDALVIARSGRDGSDDARVHERLFPFFGNADDGYFRAIRGLLGKVAIAMSVFLAGKALGSFVLGGSAKRQYQHNEVPGDGHWCASV